MNSIHEPGSRTMSKNRFRNRTESNRAKNRLSALSAQPTGPVARPGCAPCRALGAARLPPTPKRPAPARPAPVYPAPVLPACVLPRPRAPALVPTSACRLRAQLRPCSPSCALASPAAPLRAQRSAKRSARMPYAQWVVAHFRFCIFFFSFLSTTGKYQKKYIYLFSFIFQYTNKLIKIYFIIIIVFFYFPTNQINCLNLFYLFSCSSLHIINSKVCFPTCLCAIYLSTQTFTSHIQHVIHTKHIHTTIHQST